MRQMCILIIDDDSEDLHIIKEAMDLLPLPQGAVCLMENPERAISSLSDVQHADDLPRLVVMDLNMPKCSGLETLRIIKAHDLLKNIPVIIFSSSSNPADAEEAKKQGAADYISKPHNFTGYKEVAEKFAAYCSI